MKTKILFVCHGNICRSPMAEFVMKEMVRKNGLEERFEIASAATSTEEIGNDIYPPAKRTLHSYGIPFTRHSGRSPSCLTGLTPPETLQIRGTQAISN